MKINNIVFERSWFKYSAVFFLAISILLIYLSPYWSFENSSRSASLIRIMLFITAIFLTIFFFIKDGSRSEADFKIAPLNCFLTVLLLYLSLNTLLLVPDSQPIRRVLVLAFLFIPFLFLQLNIHAARFLAILIAIVIACFSMYSLINQFFQGGLPTGYRKGSLFNSGTDTIASFGNTIVAAMHYAIGFTILAYLFFTEPKRPLVFLWAVLLSFVAVYIILTFARSAWVACFVATIVIYALTFNRRNIRFYIVPALFVALILYFSINFIGYEFGERGLTRRDDIWKVVISRIDGSWLFGHGLATSFEPIPILTDEGYVFVHNSHNLYLEIIYQVGLVGLLLYISTLLAAIYTLYKCYIIKIYSDLSVLFLALLVSVSVVMLTELNSWMHTPNLIWMWLWVPIAVTLSFERELKEKLSKP